MKKNRKNNIEPNMDKLSEKFKSEARTWCKRRTREKSYQARRLYKQNVKAKKNRIHERIPNIESGENSDIGIQRSPK